ncbi:MAG TPA: hypothetical protein VKF17_13965 [Isosphaeraceae bacterium]|nr:hypothetical protein [Isosphaeraceae bacterium]
MQRQVVATIVAGMLMALGVGSSNSAQAAAPAPASYIGVEKTISSIRDSWSRPGAVADPNAPGWNVFFDALLDDLRTYSQADNPADRLIALNRIYQMSVALAVVPWAPALQLREELRQWLRPRVRLAWAERRLDETVRNLPPSLDPSIIANRQRWVDFVSSDLGQAMSEYNGASTVAQRQDGLKRVHEALRSLQTHNQDRPWQPAWELQTAVNDLFNQPNLDLTADVYVVQPVFDQNLVTSGPVYRKGYWSQVTAGPKTGFGLLPSDDGIVFYNSQLLTTATPVTDFQNQIASDPQGRKAAKLYEFSATSYDAAQLTVYTVLRASGLTIWPAYNHNIDASICSAPEPGGGFGRLVAAMIGMNQNKITQKVYEGAIGNFRQRIPQEAQEEAQERIAGQQAERNAQLAQYLIGNNTLAFQNFLISGLSLRSRPEAVYVGGLLQSRSGDRQRGADAPQPAKLATPDPGLTADVHLSSVLNSVADGLYQRGEVQQVSNLVIVTKHVPPGSPPQQGATITENMDFPAYARAVDEARKANNPKVTAIRVKRPAQAPEFAVDARGYLVALLRDVEIEVPAPDKSSQAGSIISVPARILRVQIPHLEVAFSYQLEEPAPGSHRIRAKVEDFAPSTTSQVLAINDDETKPSPLTRFGGALVISAIGARLRSQPIVADLDNLNLRGFAIQSISPLDPSGWVRVTLARALTAAPVATAAAPAPAVVEPVQTYPVATQPVQTYYPVATQPVQTYPVAAEAVQVPAATVLVPAGPVAVAQ